MRKALQVGQRILADGGTATEAVTASIVFMEDSGLFNAGRGGIANKAGFVELDASIMRGSDRNAGAVAAVRSIKNPILAARAVMERSEHVMIVDRGAEAFAQGLGLTMVKPNYFLKARSSKSAKSPKSAKPSKSGTVGAVARDRCGHLAGGTSTGGYNAKTPGRVGDAPLIGSGTYADNQTCAVSATGWGEYFVRWAAAYDVCALMAYKSLPVERAARQVLAKIKAQGATGGLIAIDRQGRMAFPFTSKGMIRGYVNHTGESAVGIFQAMERSGPSR